MMNQLFHNSASLTGDPLSGGVPRVSTGAVSDTIGPIHMVTNAAAGAAIDLY